MDLSVFTSTAESGEWLVLLDPITQEKTDARILISGEESEKYKGARHEIINRRLRKKQMVLDAATLEKEVEVTLIASIKAWENISLGTEALECTQENIEMLFAQARFKWIKKQAEDFLGNEANFIKISKP
jgi:hypothetical protein